MNNGYKALDLTKIKAKGTIVSSKDALKEVTPINWSKEVINGQKKVIIKQH